MLLERNQDAAGSGGSTQMSRVTDRSRAQAARYVLVLLGLCGALFLFRAGSLPLADPDEARAAIIVQHMVKTGKWLIPYKADKPWMDKPAPYYWLVAAGQYITGDLEMGGRGVSGAFATLAVLAAFAWGRRAAGNFTGLVAGVILATSAGFMVAARLYRMDMPFAALMFLALWWFWRYEQPLGAERRAGNKRWLGFYAFCAAATLIKGPAGLVLPVLVVATYLLVSGRWRRVGELANIPGILIFLVIAAPWYVAAGMVSPDYAYEFLIVQNFARFAVRAIEQKQFPGLYYIVILLGGMLPWTIYLPGAITRSFPARWSRRAQNPTALFCWIAVLVPLAFFMVSRTKLELYILPVAAPLAVAIALPLGAWVESSRRDRLYHVGSIAMRLSVMGMIVALGVYEFQKGWLDLWIVLPAVLVAVSLVPASLSLRHGRRRRYIGWAAATVCATLIFGIAHTGPRALAMRSCSELGQALRPRLTDDAFLCYFGPRRYSFPLYAGRTSAVRFLAHWDEDRQRLVALMDGPRPAYCLLEGRKLLGDLQARCDNKLTVVAQRDRYFLVTNRAEAYLARRD